MSPVPKPVGVLNDAPTGLVISKIKTDRVTLTWHDNSTRENAYRVYRSSDGGAIWEIFAQTPPNDTSYVAQYLTDATRYLFRVCATLPKKKLTDFTQTIAVWTPPNAPVALSAAGEYGLGVGVGWTPESLYASGLRVERSTDGTNFSAIATLDRWATGYGDTTASAGVHYWYRVVALCSGGKESAPTNVAGVTPLAKPKNLTATVISTSRVDLKWDGISGAQGYQIDRSGNGKDWKTLASLSASARSYSDTSGDIGQPYFYRLQATAASAVSAYATTVLPATPSLEWADYSVAGQITLRWDWEDGVTEYSIERRVVNGTFSAIGSPMVTAPNSSIRTSPRRKSITIASVRSAPAATRIIPV